MSGDSLLETVRNLMSQCSPEDRRAVFLELRATHQIHEFEQVIGAPAEMILEAVHRAPELTRRMLRGVVGDAAFRTYVVPALSPTWSDATEEGNFPYDYRMRDALGDVTVQVKLQRSEKGAPVVRRDRYGFGADVFIVETQKTRTGSDGDEKTRPYRYGEFDVLAVSMQPSTGSWKEFRYTLGRWLIPGKRAGEIATLQPVAMSRNGYWTYDFSVAAGWFRAADARKQMTVIRSGSQRRTKASDPGSRLL